MKKTKSGKRAAAKRHTPRKPTKTVYSVLRQLVQWIPGGLVQHLADGAGLDIRRWSAVSHVVALMYGQVTGCGSLNGIVDAARVHESQWRSVRGAQPPKRNTFSNANRTRDASVAEKLYWSVFEHLVAVCPGFGAYRKHMGFLARLKRGIYAIDSSTIKLALNCIDWAKHRQRKAAAKLHMRLDIGPRLPAFAVVEDAGHHDSKRAWTLCEGVKPGDCVVADRAYTDFGFMFRLDGKGAFFVVREKTNMRFKVLEKRAVARAGKDAKVQVLADETVEPVLAKSKALYPKPLRRVRARVEVDGKMAEMVFLTNNFDWSARTVAELYKARWSVELFFKELKQTCQIHDFVGYNENAVKWQVWTGMLVHLLLRFMKHLSRWDLSFSRLVGIVRAAVWVKRDLLEILGIYGTASPPKTDGTRQKPPPIQAYFEFARFDYGTA
jgi:hypothetical protein